MTPREAGLTDSIHEQRRRQSTGGYAGRNIKSQWTGRKQDETGADIFRSNIGSPMSVSISKWQRRENYKQLKHLVQTSIADAEVETDAIRARYLELKN